MWYFKNIYLQKHQEPPLSFYSNQSILFFLAQRSLVKNFKKMKKKTSRRYHHFTQVYHIYNKCTISVTHLLSFITGFCSGIPCSSVWHFVETSFLTFIAIQLTGCHVIQDLGVGNLETDYKRFYICFTVLQFNSFGYAYVCVYVYMCV